ncbi:MAG: hypothetical protein HYV63_24675 [Candidatus Schekmanbacteria bacterium]|nr:hypothetical protein [Candidatus Schekmanbacteria bacterium]
MSTEHCEKGVAWATQFAAGELGAFSRWRFKRHRATCKACTRAVLEMQEAMAALSVLDFGELAAGRRELLRAAAERAAAERAVAGFRHEQPRRWWRQAVACQRLVAAAAVVSVAVLVAREAPCPRQGGPAPQAPQVPGRIPDPELAWDAGEADFAALSARVGYLKTGGGGLQADAGTGSIDAALRAVRARLEQAQAPES